MYIAEHSIVEDVSHGKNSKIFRNVRIRNCKLGDNVTIGDDSLCDDSNFENNVMIQRRNWITGSSIGRYSNVGLDTKIRFSDIGAFSSISWNVSIGCPNHDYKNISTDILGEEYVTQKLKQLDQCIKVPKYIEKHHCIVGNDVWIGGGH